MSFLAKVNADNSNLVWLVKGRSNNLDAWWFVLVDKLRLHSFKAALATGSLQISEFGSVINSGYGAQPSESAIEAVRQKGFKLQVVSD